VAHANANSNDVEIDFRLADVLDLDFTQRFRGPFDLVISNPPYIPAEDRASIMPEVRDFEPEVALFVSGDPVVYYRAIARHATDLLNARGRIVLEIHEDHAGPVMQTLEQAGLREVELHTDFAGRPRIVTTRV
jgi:release factor glutamine methyltransferase